MKNRIRPTSGAGKYILAFCLTVLLALALLVGGAFLPQEQIQQHILDSVPTASLDIENNYLFDRSAGSKLDVGTDLLMLRISLSTNDRYLGSVLTNPVYTYDGLSEWDDIDETLSRLAYEMPHDGVWFYARYWLGVRTLLRLALTFFSYAQIKRYLAFLFFTLFAAAMCSVAKHANARIAFLFAVSVILVRPHVMATSMQLSCCFLIAFLAMLPVPWLHDNPRHEKLFFMEIGMITMYFDFYTVPLVTFGLPMLYLCALRGEKGDALRARGILGDFSAWFLGYVFMWLAKLTLTSVLTSVNAFAQGLSSLLSRMGIRKTAELQEYYSLTAAFDGIREAVFSDEAGAKVYLLCAGLIAGIVLVNILRKRISAEAFRRWLPLLLLAAMPLLWFCATKQPVAIHSYFQYRSIALTHWAAGLYFYFLLRGKTEMP